MPVLGQGTPDPTETSIAEGPEYTTDKEMDVTDGETGGVREEILGATPTDITAPVVRKPATTVFILSSQSADNATLSVCIENAGNRVVTPVDKATKSSSCSREGCQQ